jgi:hypothetical protein
MWCRANFLNKFCRPFGTGCSFMNEPSAKALGYFREIPAGLGISVPPHDSRIHGGQKFVTRS